MKKFAKVVLTLGLFSLAGVGVTVAGGWLVVKHYEAMEADETAYVTHRFELEKSKLREYVGSVRSSVGSNYFALRSALKSRYQWVEEDPPVDMSLNSGHKTPGRTLRVDLDSYRGECDRWYVEAVLVFSDNEHLSDIQYEEWHYSNLPVM